MLTSEKATLAAGCFWGVEKNLHDVRGVVETIVGYAGGHLANPSYRDVCSGRSGHLEAVQVTFDPAVIAYRELLDVFWSIHDPTNARGQGPDVGEQYLSAIFVHSERQRQEAQESIIREGRSGKYRHPIATRILPVGLFWPAEEEHQKYFLR